MLGSPAIRRSVSARSLGRRGSPDRRTEVRITEGSFPHDFLVRDGRAQIGRWSNVRTQAVRILVIGAGVIGSVYAGLLADAGHDVTVVARGGRLDNLRHQGLRLRSVDGSESRPSVSIVDAVPDTPFDLVVIAVRREQAVFAAVQAARSNAIDALFFGNFAGMVADLGASIGRDRALAGFPGVGGRIERDGSVTYVVIGQQPTVVGTIGGSPTRRLSRPRRRYVKRGSPPSSSPTSTDGSDLMRRSSHPWRPPSRPRAGGRTS